MFLAAKTVSIPYTSSAARLFTPRLFTHHAPISSGDLGDPMSYTKVTATRGADAAYASSSLSLSASDRGLLRVRPLVAARLRLRRAMQNVPQAWRLETGHTTPFREPAERKRRVQHSRAWKTTKTRFLHPRTMVYLTDLCESSALDGQHIGRRFGDDEGRFLPWYSD